MTTVRKLKVNERGDEHLRTRRGIGFGQRNEDAALQARGLGRLRIYVAA